MRNKINFFNYNDKIGEFRKPQFYNISQLKCFLAKAYFWGLSEKFRGHRYIQPLGINKLTLSSQ